MPGTFVGSLDIPSGEITKPKNVVVVMLNSHFSGLTYSSASYSFSGTLRTCW